MKVFFVIVAYFAMQTITSQNVNQKRTIEFDKEIQTLLNKTIDNKKVFGVSFAVKKNEYTWVGAAGNMTASKSYFIASTTKLFTTAIVMHLKSEGKLNLEDKISKYLDNKIIDGLHKFKAVDYSGQITIKHLLSHTSGLPDYFQNKGANGRSLEDELIEGKDQNWNFEQCINRTKLMTPLFAPGTPGKAHYSDANFQLLGKIIETITQKSYAENCKQLIIQPLGMKNTYLYTNANDTTPKSLYYKTEQLHIPKAMTSFGPDGGMVSTSTDMLVFIEAFFTGRLFPSEYIDEMKVWNNIFFPMQSGVGMHLFKLPWAVNPTGAVPDFIGHSGLSGSLAFYSPKDNMYIVGTVNQIANPDISFKTMIFISQIMKDL